MKTQLSSVVILVILFCITSSCDTNYSEIESAVKEKSLPEEKVFKDGSHAKGKISKQLLLLAGLGLKKWQVTKYIINGVDYTNILFGECSLDNIQIFSLSKRYLEIEGATKCDESDPYLYDSGTFEFSENYTKWTLASTHLNTTFDVLELKVSSFKISYIDPAFGEVEIWLEAYQHNRRYDNAIRENQKEKYNFKNMHHPFLKLVIKP